MSTETRVYRFHEAGPLRLDHFLVTVLPDHSRSFLQNLIKDGMVSVEGVTVTKTGFKLEGTKAVKVIVPPPADSDLVPEDIPLDIIYEDGNLIAINKPAGMVVHPSAGHDSGTLVHAVLAHCPDIEGVGGVRRPGIVHRLDKDTSGLILVARNAAAQRHLQMQFAERRTEKTYLALAAGKPPTPEGRIETHIGRDPSHRQRMAVVPPSRGRPAATIYSTREQLKDFTLLEVHPLTGRTHQVRVHLAYIGCPVAGDGVYGSPLHIPPNAEGIGGDTGGSVRQLLHAWKLKITLPGEAEPREFEAPLPEDFQHFLESISP